MPFTRVSNPLAVTLATLFQTCSDHRRPPPTIGFGALLGSLARASPTVALAPSQTTNTTSSFTCLPTAWPPTVTRAPARVHRVRALSCSPGPRPRRLRAHGPTCPAGPTRGTETAAAGSSRRGRRRIASSASPGPRGRALGLGSPTPPTSPRGSSHR